MPAVAPLEWATKNDQELSHDYRLVAHHPGLVTLLLTALPGKSKWWNVGLLVVGVLVFLNRR